MTEIDKSLHVNDNEVARCWDDNAEVWARHVRAGYDIYRDYYNNPAFFEFVGDLSGKEVLDAGCGEGYNTRHFARQGAKMTGIDISRKLITLAQSQEKREPLGIRYKTGSFSHMSQFAEESFDAVISTMALMDCSDYAGALGEFHRVLRSGGRIFFNTLHPCFAFSIRQWQHDENGTPEGILIGDYFAEGPRTECWRFGAAPKTDQDESFTIIYFHRILSEYLNPLCAAGFRLEAVAEPRPTEEACAAQPRLRKHRLVPLSLCVKAVKTKI